MGTPAVLQVTAIPLTAAHFLLPLAQALRAAGYQVHFASGPGSEQLRARLAAFPLHRLPLSRTLTSLRNGWAVWQLVRLLRQQRFAIVHAHTPVAGFLARLAARLAGVPIVFYTLHGSVWGAEVSLRSRLFTLAERLAARWTDHIFVLNERDQQELLQRRFYQPTQITNLGVGGGGVDLQRFDRQQLPPDTRQRLRQTLQIPLDAPVIGYLGRVVREKGVLDLVAAFTQVQQTLPAVHLLLAGGSVSGEWDAVGEADIQAALGAQQQLRSRIHLTGFRDDVPALLALMDVVVLPSWREGFGMALAEAGAMELPVVATRTPGGEQAVVHGETGLLTPIRDPAALAAALGTLLTDPALAQRMGQAGRRRAIACFDQQQMIARQVAVYQRFCKARVSSSAS